MKKLAIIASHPIQYNAPWFRHLAATGETELAAPAGENNVIDFVYSAFSALPSAPRAGRSGPAFDAANQ